MVKPKDSISCQDVKEWLFAGSPDSVESAVGRELYQHLERCQQCRAYKRLLTRVRSELEENFPDGLEPDPAIQDRLRNTLRKKGLLVAGLQILRRPVPAYQAVLGVAAAIAAVLIIENSSSVEQRVHTSSEEPRNEFIAVESTEAIDMLRMIRRSGRSHAEDSLLVGSMPESFATLDGAS